MAEYPSWQLHLAVIDLRLCGQDAAPGVGGRGVSGSDVLTARLHERALGGEETLATLRFFVMFGIHLVQHRIQQVASLIQATVSCWVGLLRES